MDNRKRIRELADEMIAIADDTTEPMDRKHLRIRVRRQAVAALLRADRQAGVKGDLGVWAKLGADEPAENHAPDSVEARVQEANELIRSSPLFRNGLPGGFGGRRR